jgi:predicted negative regulator of RcsB-dependent stress response
MLNFLKNNVKEIVIGVFLLVIIVLGYFLFDTLQTVNKMTDPFNDAKEILDRRLEQSEEKTSEIMDAREKLLREKRKSERELSKILETTEEAKEQIKFLRLEIEELNRIEEMDRKLSDGELTDFINKTLLEN